MPTLNILIATGADDGNYRQDGNGFTNSDGFLYLGSISGIPHRAFFRFQNVTIPPGSTITAASIRFVDSAGITTTPCNLIAKGELAVNPSAATSGSDANSRAKTTATVSWAEPGWSFNSSNNTPDLSAIVQEIIDQVGWASGNAMQLFVEDNGGSDANGSRLPRTYNNSAINCPRLDITYTDPPAGNRRRRFLTAA